MASLDKMALALSDRIRLRILDLLAAGRNDACCSPANPDAPVALCSCDLLPTLGVAPSRLSYHMGQLKEAGLVSEQKAGRWVYYTLDRGAIAEFATAVCERFVKQTAAVGANPICQSDEAPIKLKPESPASSR